VEHLNTLVIIGYCVFENIYNPSLLFVGKDKIIHRVERLHTLAVIGYCVLLLKTTTP